MSVMVSPPHLSPSTKPLLINITGQSAYPRDMQNQYLAFCSLTVAAEVAETLYEAQNTKIQTFSEE